MGDNQALESKKSTRVRKKRLHAMILHQMEFYFSNSSLTRDKYMCSLLEKDKFIPISKFLEFNKIKALTAEKEDITQALSTSQFLQLSPDGSAVCRRLPFTPKEDAELCTIYVENVPRGCGPDALRRTFSAYGTIDYVSAPVHRVTGQRRGFGFVEFRTPNMAHNALHAFGALGRRMPSEHYPEYLSPPEPAEDIWETEEQEEEEVLPDCSAGPVWQPDHSATPIKRKLSTDSSSREAPMKMTRFADTPESGEAPGPAEDSTSATAGDTENSNLSESHAEGTTSCSEPPREDAASLGTSQLTERTDDTELSERRGRRRRRTRRGRRHRLGETEHTELLALQIMPLSEWMRYRHQYRSLQKENMSAIKQSLREEAPPQTVQAPQRTAGAPDYVPATVVRFTPDLSGTSSQKQLITSLKSLPGVLYVDLPAGSGSGYLRFDSPAAAAAACVASDLRDAALLQGGEEANYWCRLKADRERVRSRESCRRSKERGRDKLLRRLKARTNQQ